MHVRGKSTQETSVPSLQLCWERKIALKDNKNKIKSLKETWLESESHRTRSWACAGLSVYLGQPNAFTVEGGWAGFSVTLNLMDPNRNPCKESGLCWTPQPVSADEHRP